MTLYLTSDETYTNAINSRTKFSNHILSDFFQGETFNLALKEIYFDPKFPTLADPKCPHVITTVFPKDHKLIQFSSELQQMSIFKSMFTNHKVDNKPGDAAPFIFQRKFPQNETDIKKLDSTVMYEIHPSLSFVFSVAYCGDININSRRGIVNFLNSVMFPLHAKKPIQYSPSGIVTIESDLNMYMSESILELLGINQYEMEDKSVPMIVFPNSDKIREQLPITDDENDLLPHDNILAKIEDNSETYLNYRKLENYEQKGKIIVEYSTRSGFNINRFAGTPGTITFKLEEEFNLSMFNSNIQQFNYDNIIDQINEKLLDNFLAVIKNRLLKVKFAGGGYTNDNLIDMENLLIFLKGGRSGLNLKKWGGVLTLKRKHNQLSVSLFHTDKNIEKFIKKSKNLMRTQCELVKQVWMDIFYEPTVIQVTFNDTFCNLFGIRNVDGNFTFADFDVSGKMILPHNMDYLRVIRMGLPKIFKTGMPWYLHLFNLYDLISDREFNLPKKLFHTDEERIYYIQNGKSYTANGKINLRRNFPKIIFIAASFAQYSLFGSEQQQILNFFPLYKDDDTPICHRFKNPIIFKTSPGAVFHIKLLDENFQSLKADVGNPTLLALEKTHQENMFPVTILSSDIKNMQLYPENKNNFFKNKLSFPLIFSDRERWTVSLRSMAFPKVKNIYPEQCKIMMMTSNSETPIHISVESSYITDIVDLLSLLNSTIRKNIKNEEHSQIPVFNFESGVVHFKTNSYNCFLEGDMMKILGLSYSYHKTTEQFAMGTTTIGVMEPNIFIFQPQEIIVLSDIVEEAFYAQSRPTILRIVPILEQTKFIGYNYVQFEEHDNVPIKLDRVHDIEIKILTRKGDYVDFVETEDVKIQLEFKIHN
jgi:hypothetical protein